MNIKDIEKIIKMLNGTDVKEITIEQDDFKIHLVRNIEENIIVQENNSISSGIIRENPVIKEEKKEEPPKNVDYIKASMPGTFYRKPSPEAEPYVKEGDIINEDTVVCIIEAMKIFNEIKAGKKGKISKVLVKDGEGIEYDQPLFEIITS